MLDSLEFLGVWMLLCRNPDGSVAWTERIKNSVVNQGLNDALSVYFKGGTQATTWYIGLIDAAGFGKFDAGDTAASHGGWTESQAYVESVRQTWGSGSPAAQSITNAASATFTCNTNNTTIKGVFLSSSNVKGGTAGKLWAEGAFLTPRVLQAGQLLHVTYILNAASGT